jgi:glycosyltransferase involved in cell wall biosynthesis
MNLSARKAQAVVALTEGDAAVWKKVSKKVFVIPDVVHLNETDVFSNHQSKSALFVGRLSRQKDIGSLLTIWQLVFQRHPDWQLHVYGEKGDIEEALWQQLQEVGHGITVHPPTADIMDIYQQHAMLLLTSRYEPFGMVLPEAMSCGLPVIAFDCPYGPADIITDGVDGFLVPSFNIRFFADRIIMLIKDEQLRKQMGENGRLKSQQYTIDKIALQWKELFDDLMQKHEVC